ncbi:helix-turn-helix domain-containing protein [Bombilactobacillus bombi]|uniref:helix-turn-helix domain-containing protein n=1 Tax=Bombilactobacillus bombi TaxID=1303590 RepID=UPI0015E5D662|nr:helix-turn-helix transcriptional regulator [Bombilactobacillus bombi]MBA1434317.1 XRE family transcriptional regulator [Bombilactobacillus bombi]
MNSLGNTVKTARKKLGMTQAQLANGICSQVTISALEHKNKIPSLKILIAIEKRLNINLLNNTGNINLNKDKSIDTLSEIIHDFKKGNIEQSYNKLISVIDINKIHDESVLTNEICFIVGEYNFLEKGDLNESLYWFNLILNRSTLNKVSITEILTASELGYVYAKQNQIIKAQHYIDLSIQNYKTFVRNNNDDQEVLYKILFKAAHFYNKYLTDQSAALKLINCGLDYLNESNSNTISKYIDNLFFEKAIISSKLHVSKYEVLNYYLFSYFYATALKNETLIKPIKDNISKLGLTKSTLETLQKSLFYKIKQN